MGELTPGDQWGPSLFGVGACQWDHESKESVTTTESCMPPFDSKCRVWDPGPL